MCSAGAFDDAGQGGNPPGVELLTTNPVDRSREPLQDLTMRHVPLLALALASCLEPSGDSQLRISDQLGDEFFWVCGDGRREEDTCEVHRIAGISPPLPECLPGEGDPKYGLGHGRLIGLGAYCHVEGSMDSIQKDRVRFLICESDDECPGRRYDGAPIDFECREGFCQNADIEEHPPSVLWAITVEELCYATAAPRFEPLALDPELEAALDVACPGRHEYRYVECVDVPAQCPDPR